MHKHVVLIANRNRILKDCLEQFLGSRYHVVSVESTQMAWTQIGENGANFVILDEVLPELGGLRLLRILKIAYPQIPVVIISNSPTYKGCLQALRYGVRDYFSVPNESNILLERIDQILKGIKDESYYGKNFYLKDIKDLSLAEREMLNESQHLNGNGIQRAIGYIQKNFQEEISRSKISQIACFSPSHFSRIFKEHTGCSYIEYLTKIRISKAKELLKSENLNITEICYSVGYNNLTNFERAFRKIAGCCPRGYRNGSGLNK